MAHIVSFKIKGLAGRDGYFSHKLNRDINVFFGLNGSGKTSLLKILHSALSGDANILRNVPFDSAEVTIYSIDYQHEVTKKIEHREHSEDRERITKIYYPKDDSDELQGSFSHILHQSVDNQFKWELKTKIPQGSSGKFRHKYLPTWRIYTSQFDFPTELFREFQRDPQLETYWDTVFAKGLELLWSNYSNQLLSQVQTIQAVGLANILKGILYKPSKSRKSNGIVMDTDIEHAYQRVAAFLERQNSKHILGSETEFKERYREDSHIQAIVRDINEIEKQIENVMSSRHSLEKLIDKIFLHNKEVSFKDHGIEVSSKKGYKIGLESLSSGEKQALRLFIETLLAENSALMIDEPEISLHIDWQRLLISAMRELNPDAQLLLATHSPEIMADVSDDKIFNLWTD